MASRRKITITPDGSIVVIKGYKIAEIARAAGLRPTYSASAGGWMLDVKRLPELVAWLEYRNFRYEVISEREPVVDGVVDVDHLDIEQLGVDDAQLDLFGGEVA